MVRYELHDGRRVVAKQGKPGDGLDAEGWMLRYLADHSDLPVPRVHHADDTLLVMDWVEGGGGLTAD